MGWERAGVSSLHPGRFPNLFRVAAGFREDRRTARRGCRPRPGAGQSWDSPLRGSPPDVAPALNAKVFRVEQYAADDVIGEWERPAGGSESRPMSVCPMHAGWLPASRSAGETRFRPNGPAERLMHTARPPATPESPRRSSMAQCGHPATTFQECASGPKADPRTNAGAETPPAQ